MADNIADDLVAAERLDQAVRMRVRGAHWGEIAERCGYPSAPAALRAVGEAMTAATLRAEMTADQYRDEANLRFEHLLGESMKMARPERHVTYDEAGNEVVQDDRSVRLKAVDEARRIILDQLKLNGADKPVADDAAEDIQVIRIVGISPDQIV